MSFTEQFMTEVLDKWVSKAQDDMAAQTAEDPNPSMRMPKWADLDKYQQQQIKQTMLPMMLDVLNAAQEVRGETFIASSYPVQDDMVHMAFLTMPVGDDTRSEWRWFRLADGDLVLGFFPCGDTYEAMERVVPDDYETALALPPYHPGGLRTHTITLED